ncbi:MAG: glycolate oxidase subunit GlcF [Pseudomonadota bacterium]
MQTNFTLAQLADSAVAESEKILRTCVHCGFCLATCPTYTLLGDELDSPRGRIYQIKDMLENDRPAPDSVVTHIDRCLSCLSCMTTCPSGVHYMHLVDHARAHIEETHRRPWPDRVLRSMLATVLPRPTLFRLALVGAMIGRPLRRFMPGRLKGMIALAPKRLEGPSPVDKPQTIAAEGPRRARVALLNGCAQQVLDPSINEATIRLLTRHGVEVVVAKRAGCCGALTHHMGKEAAALRSVKSNVDAWSRELKSQGGGGLDAIVINTSGCGTTVKDYGFMLRDDPAYAEQAAEIADLAKDVSEFMDEFGLMPPVVRPSLHLAYHAACSLQHGQQVRSQPKALLTAAGFSIAEVPEGHLCCGSAGTYNLMQPDLATALKNRKVGNIERLKPDAVAAGNIGCLTQIGSGTALPVVHTVALLDWATGGPMPPQLEPVVAAKPDQTRVNSVAAA